MRYLILLVSFLITLIITSLARKLAVKLKIYDMPEKTKIHKKPVPYLGGTSIFIGFLVSILIGTRLYSFDTVIRKQLYLILICSFILFTLGLLDDIKQVKAIYKLAFEFLIIAALFFMGLRLSILQNTFLNFIFITFWIIFIINAFNNIDGLDGLAAGIAVICCLFFIVIYSIMGSTLAVILSLALMGSSLAFLIFNFNPAAIFMGDAGTLFIGFILSVIPLVGFVRTSNKLVAVAVPILILSYLILDSSFVLINRFLQRKNLFMGDLEHTYNLLFNRLKSQKKTVSLIYMINILLGILSVFLVLGVVR